MAPVWTSTPDPNGEVVVVLPSGEELTYEELTAEKLRNIAADAGIANFIPKDEEGEQLEQNDFPITEGRVVIVEHNEPK